MAVSEKFSNFAKTRKSALKGKAGAGLYSFAGSYDCAGTPVTVYTSSSTLTIGTVLYYNPELTLLYIDGYGDFFAFNDVVYIVGLDSTITTTYIKLNYSLATFTGCSNFDYTGSFIYTQTGFTLGARVYNTCYASEATAVPSQTFYVDISNTSSASNTIITTDGQGYISSIIACGT